MQEALELWVKEQWENGDLGDRRRNKRAIKIAASLMNKPDSSLPLQLEDWKDLKAAYRFLNNEEISHDSIQASHRQRVLRSAEQEAVTLFIQDTSELDYTSHGAATGLGPIGRLNSRGMLIHTALAVSYQKNSPKILGLAHQKVVIRENIIRGRDEKWSKKKKRSRESSLWKETLAAIPKPSGVRWISVGDRANDVYDFFIFCRDHQWDYLIRANQDRTIILDAGKKSYLKEWARNLPSAAQKTITLRGRKESPAREIDLKVSWAKIALLHPKNYGKKYENIQLDVWCIRCWEEAPNGIEWILLSSLPVLDANSALEKIDWYSSRWLIEEYHKCLKTGCAIEKRQLRTSEGLLAMLGFLGIIATKLLDLKFVARQQSEDLAKNYIPPINLHIICSRFRLDQETITLKQYWHKVASFGGFIGRKSDGDPGWQTLWKGTLRLLDMVSGAESFKSCG